MHTKPLESLAQSPERPKIKAKISKSESLPVFPPMRERTSSTESLGNLDDLPSNPRTWVR